MNSSLVICLQYEDKKAFQWNANHPLADSTGYIVYILNIWGWVIPVQGGGPEALNSWERLGLEPLWTDRQSENITFATPLTGGSSGPNDLRS